MIVRPLTQPNINKTPTKRERAATMLTILPAGRPRFSRARRLPQSAPHASCPPETPVVVTRSKTAKSLKSAASVQSSRTVQTVKSEPSAPPPVPLVPTVYISYDRRHRNSGKVAREIANFLAETEKFKINIDVEIGLGLYGEDKYERVTEAMKTTHLAIIVYNENYQNNGDCQREATLAVDVVKKVLFVKGQADSFRLEDWFYTMKGGRIDIDYCKADTNALERIRWQAFDMLGMNVATTPTEAPEGDSSAINNVPTPHCYYDRPSCEDELFDGIRSVCANPECGAFIVAGDAGVGKTTLLERILTDNSNRDLLVNECKIGATVWLNCFEWRDSRTFTARQQRTFVRDLLEKINAVKFQGLSSATNFLRLDDFKEFIKDQPEKVLFVLDDVFNETLVQFFRKRLPTVPCCMITRDPVTLSSCQTPQYQQQHPLVSRVVKIAELSANEIAEMLQVTFALDAKLSHEQITSLAQRCCGLPLIASLLAGSIKGCEEEQYNSLIATDVGQMNIGGSYGNVSQLFEFSLNLLNVKLRRAYYSFLLFDPEDPISETDMAILWGHDPGKKKQTEKLCQVLADKFLIRKATQNPTPDGENYWYLHQLLHEATAKHAADFYNNDDDEFALKKLRLRIVTGHMTSRKDYCELIASPGSTRKLLEAVKLRRLSLLTKIIENIDPADLAELCRQKPPEAEGMTFLHYLYTINWAVTENTYFGANISYRLIREIIFKLREFKVDFISLVNENDEGAPTEIIEGHGKPKNLREHVFNEKDVWQYTPDRNGLIEILGLSMQKLNDEKKWEEAFCLNEAYRTFLEIIHEPNCLVNFETFIMSYDGRSLNKRDQGELLMCATRKGNFDVVARLLYHFPKSVQYCSRSGLTAMMLAAANNHLKIVQHLCEKYMDPSVQDNTGWNALMHATFNGNLEVVDYLHQKTPKIAYEKPLMIAASNGYLDIVEYLVEKHQEIANYQDPKTGLTPLMCASRCGYLPIVEYIHMAAPGSVRYAEKNGWTALMYAASGGHIDTVDYLCYAYSEAVTRSDAKGLTPLMCAARYGHFEVVTYLFDKDPYATTAKDKDGKTALLHAAAAGQTAVVRELKEREAKRVLNQTPRTFGSRIESPTSPRNIDSADIQTGKTGGGIVNTAANKKHHHHHHHHRETDAKEMEKQSRRQSVAPSALAPTDSMELLDVVDDDGGDDDDDVDADDI